MNFRLVLVLSKTAGSAQAHKSMSFIWKYGALYMYISECSTKVRLSKWFHSWTQFANFVQFKCCRSDEDIWIHNKSSMWSGIYWEIWLKISTFKNLMLDFLDFLLATTVHISRCFSKKPFGMFYWKDAIFELAKAFSIAKKYLFSH